MDSHFDLYGSEQVSVAPPTYYGDVSKPSLRTPVVTRGYYEDQLTLEQQGLPARLRGSQCNPHIQDKLSNSQRHNPIRIGSVEERAAHIAHDSCQPGLADMYGGQPCGYARDQGLVYVPAGTQCPHVAGVGRVAACNHDHQKSLLPRVDSHMLLWMFLIVIVVYLVMNNLTMMGSLRSSLGMAPQYETTELRRSSRQYDTVPSAPPL